MQTVSNILKEKGYDVWTISPNAFVKEALMLLAEKNVGALMVIENDKLVGIISERDYARKVILTGRNSEEIRVRDIMSIRIYSVRPEQTIEECMALMTEKHIRHLPVMKEGKLTGVLSIGDVVKIIISDKESTIEQLERYITGVPYSGEKRRENR